MTRLVLIALTSILIENFVLVKFYGCCPFMGVSSNSKSSVGMGLAVTFTMVLSTCITWLIYHLVLVPFSISYLKTIVFISVIAGIVQLTEVFLKKNAPAMYSGFGIYLPLITTNCSILGVCLQVINTEYSFIDSLVYSFGAGIGFLVAIYLLSVIRERIQYSDVPKPFKGVPIALIAAGLLSLSFMGFHGITF